MYTFLLSKKGPRLNVIWLLEEVIQSLHKCTNVQKLLNRFNLIKSILIISSDREKRDYKGKYGERDWLVIPHELNPVSWLPSGKPLRKV